MCAEDTSRMATSADPYQEHSDLGLKEQSDICLHCLPWPVCSNTQRHRGVLLMFLLHIGTCRNQAVHQFLAFSLSKSLCHICHLMRLWHFSSSINSFFKCTYAAIHWGQMSDFWMDPSSTSILHVCEQRRLWRDCADAQARLSLRWLPMW